MFEKFLENSTYKSLLSALENGDNISVFGLNTGEKLALIDDVANVFYVVDSLEQANIVCDLLTSRGKTCEILSQNITCLTSEFESFENIVRILNRLKNNELDVLILTPEVLAGKFPTPSRIQKLEITKGLELSVSDFIKTLISLGYKRVDLVVNPNEFSVRGDIVDIYSMNSSPTRIFFEYDTIESIKYYNSITMLTTQDVSQLEIINNTYYSVKKEDIDEFYNTNKLKYDDLYFELIENDKTDYRLIVFDKGICCSIFDYVDNGLIVFDGTKAIHNKLVEYTNQFNNSIAGLDKSLGKVLKNQQLNLANLLKFSNNFQLLGFHVISESNRIFAPNKVFNIRTLPSVNYSNYSDSLILDVSNYIKQNYTVILCAGNNENVTKLSSILERNMINYNVFARISQSVKHCVNIISSQYPYDVILPEDRLAVVSTTNLFGRKKKVIDNKHNFFDGEVPEFGDYVVHSTHGVGKCLGVNTLEISNGYRDYVVIEYKNNDKLYLPVENIDQISKYIGGDKEPTLNKIGGVEFAKTKAKVKSAVKKIAFDLIALYRERLNLKGLKYPTDDDIQKQFENQFGFNETVDQLKAIEDCKSDMHNGKVMDRLICGDVGFGKTEVALRIAFKTILAGKQVALLCPTTILSEQHFSTAKARMTNFGIKVEVLNRLKTKEAEENIKKDISSGKIDLICGTHKLLSSDIDYKNLGLLILDEEQKFGVADKEKIKNMKKNINVLTLSATPIPRTLNMSLIGVRDISVIETPPIQRIPSDVQVVEYSDYILKSAIEREIARGGQVLIIYNKVESIYNFASYVSNFVKDVTIAVAHGQMNSTELENQIFNLYSGKTQVLIATTLIENGVDLPNANTLIVINSDYLGLSQLYQLKGRIGRSDKQSYAYFTFDSRKTLSDMAYKRLQAIKEFSEMGSGFKIAMRDLEIRGAGSLLGLEQSGHIEKIGYNLYVQLLGDSVKELKGEKVAVRTDVRVETSLSAYLSHNFVESSARRMSMYREIASIDSLEKLTQFIKNTESIYGDVPIELINLSKIGLIKNLCAVNEIYKISIKDKCCIYFEGKESITTNLLDANEMYSDNISLNLSQSPIVEITGINRDEILDFLINYLQLIDKN